MNPATIRLLLGVRLKREFPDVTLTIFCYKGDNSKSYTINFYGANVYVYAYANFQKEDIETIVAEIRQKQQDVINAKVNSSYTDYYLPTIGRVFGRNDLIFYDEANNFIPIADWELGFLQSLVIGDMTAYHGYTDALEEHGMTLPAMYIRYLVTLHNVRLNDVSKKTN